MSPRGRGESRHLGAPKQHLLHGNVSRAVGGGEESRHLGAPKQHSFLFNLQVFFRNFNDGRFLYRLGWSIIGTFTMVP
jgi:hypothetical protein